MNKRVLYMTTRPFEINTSASIRNRATILGLQKNECEVDVVTTQLDKSHSAYDSSLSIDRVRVQYLPATGLTKVAKAGRNIIGLRKLRRLAYNFLQSHEIYDQFKGVVSYVDRIDMTSKPYDLVISSSDPKSSHLLAEMLLKKHKKDYKGKWVQIWGDPFAGDITRTGNNAKQVRLEEERLLAQADYVIYVSKLTLEEQKNRYPRQADKMFYLPIPYMNETIYDLRDLRSVAKVELAYCGDYNVRIRNIIPLADSIEQSTGLHLTVCGGSDAPLTSSENVSVRGRVPHNQVDCIEKSADILVFLANRSGGQIPGKIYQYLGTNKPILFILDGDCERIKNQFKGLDQIFFVENTSESILKGIQEIIQKNTSYIPVREYSKEYIAEQMLRLVGGSIFG